MAAKIRISWFIRTKSHDQSIFWRYHFPNQEFFESDLKFLGWKVGENEYIIIAQKLWKLWNFQTLFARFKMVAKTFLVLHRNYSSDHFIYQSTNLTCYSWLPTIELTHKVQTGSDDIAFTIR